jgi:hypothetical protein
LRDCSKVFTYFHASFMNFFVVNECRFHQSFSHVRAFWSNLFQMFTDELNAFVISFHFPQSDTSLPIFFDLTPPYLTPHRITSHPPSCHITSFSSNVSFTFWLKILTNFLLALFESVLNTFVLKAMNLFVCAKDADWTWFKHNLWKWSPSFRQHSVMTPNKSGDQFRSIQEPDSRVNRLKRMSRFSAHHQCSLAIKNPSFFRFKKESIYSHINGMQWTQSMKEIPEYTPDNCVDSHQQRMWNH